MSGTSGGRPPEVAGLPCLSPLGERRQARLADARLAVRIMLALVPDPFTLARILCASSVDLLVVDAVPRDQSLARQHLDELRMACDDSGALLILAGPPIHDAPADGYHLRSEDDVDAIRRQTGPDAIIGRTVLREAELTHEAEEDVDYLVLAPGLVPAAVAGAAHTWFVEVLRPDDVDEHLASGARRVLVDADALGRDSPSAATWALRRALGRYH